MTRTNAKFLEKEEALEYLPFDSILEMSRLSSNYKQKFHNFLLSKFCVKVTAKRNDCEQCLFFGRTEEGWVYLISLGDDIIEEESLTGIFDDSDFLKRIDLF